MPVLSRIIASFDANYARRPVATTMVTNALLGGIADTIAQNISMARGRSAKAEDVADGVSHVTEGRQASSFDYTRLFRFVGYGLFMTPIQLKWYTLLSRWFPLEAKRPTLSAVKRVTFDQLAFAPVGLVTFFSVITFLEGGSRQTIKDKFGHAYVPSLKTNYMVWPAVQLVNFRIMPTRFQVPFVSTVGIAWTAYLSLMNSKESHALEDLDS